MLTAIIIIFGILFYITFSVVTCKVIEGVSDEDIEDLDSEVILIILLGCAFWPLTVILVLCFWICTQIYKYLYSFSISFSKVLIRTLKK